MKSLTKQQQRIYDYILRFSAQQGYPPSVREIAAAVGLKSPSTVHFHLKALEEAGMISRDSGKTRAITPGGEAVPKANQVPLVGNVAAGAPILAEELVEDYLPYDTSGISGTLFALRIRGESMINAGILPGDCVIVRQQPTANQGEIVIALIGEEATCKRLDIQTGHVWLLPENPDYEPIDGAEASILGKVVGLVRRYQ